MPKIETLVADIEHLLENPHEHDSRNVQAYSDGMARRLSVRLAEQQRSGGHRLSSIGKPCARQVWYDANSYSRELLPASARFKFLFGDIIEETLLFLAREAGHTVTDEQRTVSINGVEGHIDALVDGELVDVKSASTPAFERFRTHSVTNDFGYLSQLSAYRTALGLPRAHFLVADKTLGHICLDTWTAEELPDVSQIIPQRLDEASKENPPHRGYFDEAAGEGGNRTLGLACSYCSHKGTCWPGLRTFIYSSGPKYFTRVNKVPVNKHGPLKEVT